MAMNEEPPEIEGHTSAGSFDGELASLHLHVVQMGGPGAAAVRDAAKAYNRMAVGHRTAHRRA